MVNRMRRLAGLIIIFFSVMLSSCVSETTGGFSQADPEDTLDVYLRLALGYVEQQDLAQARRHLANASAIDPNNSDVYGIWGLVYTLEGDLELADQSFLRALRLDSRNSQVRNNYAAFLFSNGRYQEAYDQLENVVGDTEYTGRAQAFENMGLAALQLDQLDAAAFAFNRALQLNSNRIRANLELSDIYLRQENTRDAGRYYQSFLTLRQFFNVQHSARSLWIGIRLEQALGRYNQMLEYGAILAELYPESSEYNLYQQLLND